MSVRPERNIYYDKVELGLTLTRPADTAQYAINDTIAASTSTAYAIEVANVGAVPGQNVNVVGAYCSSTNPAATPVSLSVWLFNSPPASPVDNAAFAITDGENDTVVGVIPISTWVKSANNSRGQAHTMKLPLKCAAADTSLYALIVANNEYQPISGEVFKFKFHIERT